MVRISFFLAYDYSVDKVDIKHTFSLVVIDLNFS